MEDTTWEQRLQALTHILTNPSTLTDPSSLHSQFFISSQVPCYLCWDYPPILCSSRPTHLLRWSFSLFLKKVSSFGLPPTSWRSKCPYHQPPPPVLAAGIGEGRWGSTEKREYVRQRLRRGRLVSHVNPMVPLLVPNLLLFSLLLWNPFPEYD